MINVGCADKLNSRCSCANDRFEELFGKRNLWKLIGLAETSTT